MDITEKIRTIKAERQEWRNNRKARERRVLAVLEQDKEICRHRLDALIQTRKDLDGILMRDQERRQLEAEVTEAMQAVSDSCLLVRLYDGWQAKRDGWQDAFDACLPKATEEQRRLLVELTEWQSAEHESRVTLCSPETAERRRKALEAERERFRKANG